MSTSPVWRYPHAVSSVLITAPSEEPLTVAEAKLRASLPWPDGDPRDEALVKPWIAAARQKVELDTGLALLKQTRRVSMVYDPGQPIPIPMHALPLMSITDAAGTPVTDVRLELAARTMAIGAGYVRGEWIIESGWPDKAALLAEAPLLVHAVGLLTAHFATFGRDLASIDEPYETPEGYAAAIAPWVQVWVI